MGKINCFYLFGRLEAIKEIILDTKDILAFVDGVRSRLYTTPFSGAQMMTVSECIRIIDALRIELLKEPADECAKQD